MDLQSTVSLFYVCLQITKQVCMVTFCVHTWNHVPIISATHFSNKKNIALSTVDKWYRSRHVLMVSCILLITSRNFNGSDPDSSLALANFYQAVGPANMPGRVKQSLVSLFHISSFIFQQRKCILTIYTNFQTYTKVTSIIVYVLQWSVL